jgi:hypothetical protein
MNEEVKVEEKKEVTVSQVMKEVQGDIDNLQTNLDNKFENLKEALLTAKPKKSFFIVPNLFWDAWFQKLFAQIISVKIWVIALITALLAVGLITNVQFASILGIIMGLKGAFQVADVWNKDPGDIERSAMDKT